MQARLSASQYGFRAGISTETALHEFVRRVEHWLVRKKPTLLQMPADQLRKTKVGLIERISNVKLYLKKCYQVWKRSKPEHCQGLHWWLATRWESRCGFLCRIPKQLPKISIFLPWNTQRCVPGRSLSFPRSGEESALGKKCSIKVLLCWWIVGQAAIKLLIKCTVTSITVLNCIRNLNQMGKQNHVSAAWISGHAKVHGNEVADYLAKSGSESKNAWPWTFYYSPVCQLC